MWIKGSFVLDGFPYVGLTERVTVEMDGDQGLIVKGQDDRILLERRYLYNVQADYWNDSHHALYKAFDVLQEALGPVLLQLTKERPLNVVAK